MERQPRHLAGDGREDHGARRRYRRNRRWPSTAASSVWTLPSLVWARITWASGTRKSRRFGRLRPSRVSGLSFALFPQVPRGGRCFTAWSRSVPTSPGAGTTRSAGASSNLHGCPCKNFLSYPMGIATAAARTGPYLANFKDCIREALIRAVARGLPGQMISYGPSRGSCLLGQHASPALEGARLLPSRRSTSRADPGPPAARHRAQPAQTVATGAAGRQRPRRQAVSSLAPPARPRLGPAGPAHRHRRGVAGAPPDTCSGVRRACLPHDQRRPPRASPGSRRGIRLASAHFTPVSPRHRSGGHHLPRRHRHVRVPDPLPARRSGVDQRDRHASVHGLCDGASESCVDRGRAGGRADLAGVDQGVRPDDADARDGRPAGGGQGVFAHPPGHHRAAAHPQPCARGPRASAVRRAHRGGPAAQDGATRVGSPVLGRHLRDPERLHARRDVGRRAASAGREPDGRRAARVPRLRGTVVRPAPSALAGRRHALERSGEHQTRLRDPRYVGGGQGPARRAPGVPRTQRRPRGCRSQP